ncbi:MAG TPA: choice-of-anchor D domain-containing protein, partial [Verrucomicrobiae bacterium]
SLTVPGANRIEWLRGGASPEAQVVTFEFSTDGSTSWIALGPGARIANGWEITGLSLPASGQVRARARVNSGIYNGSSGLVETSASFSGFVASAPLVITGNATNVIDVSATLTASINPGGSPATAQFEFGTTTNYGSVASLTLTPTNGAAAQTVSTAIGGLTPGTSYHFRAMASNSVGLAFGSNQTFSTPLFPDIAIEHPAGTNLINATGSISFGASLVGTTNFPKTFIIRNVGLTNLTGIVITKDGTQSNDFTLNTNGMSTTLAPGGSTMFSLVFTAAATGLRTAAVHIASSDPDENPFDVGLLGSGYQPGNIDTNFIIGAGNTVHPMAVQPDGKVVIGGFFTTIGSIARSRLARFNTDGTLDSVFNPNASSDVYSLAVQGDGKILVGGGFSTIAGAARNRIARLNADGTIDSAFNPNISTGFTVYDLTVLPDGKILLAGDFSVIAGATRNRIARLNTDGTLDANFNPNVNNTIHSFAVQADGKIIIGGLFTTVGGVTRNNFARLNADGTLDNAFAPTVGSTVYCIAVQPDGKILLGGVFSTVNGTPRTSFARLNADGTLDSFNPAPNSTIYSLSLQANGKLVIAGSYSIIAAATRNRIARFNADGTLDGVFNPDANSLVYGTAIQGDGMIVLGGSFTTVGGLPRTNIARVFNDGITQALTVPSANRMEWLRGGAAPEAQSVTFDFSTDAGTNWIALGAGSRISGGWELTGFTLPSSGLVRARARLVGGAYNGSAGLTEATAPFSGFAGSAPLIATGGASNITDIAATLYAAINPAGAATTAVFEYGTTTNYGSMASITFSPTNGATTQTVSAAVSGLAPGTTHHYRIVASNSVGTTYGNDLTFDTLLYPDIVVEHPSGTNLVDGLGTNNFGASLLGTTNAPRTFIIRNVGLTNLTGLAITKDGTHSGDFILDTNGMNTSIAPGDSTAFSVIFVTGSTGTRTAAIHIANNDPDENPFDIALVGSGYRAGDLDTNFNPNATGSSPSISGLAIQPDGKLIVGGDFTGISGTTRSYLARLNLDGTVDPTFTNANAAVQCVVLQPDGKVLVGGDFTLIAGVSRTRVARLNANGTLDMSFSNNVNSTVYNMALQPDGKIVVGGAFSTVAGISRLRLARLNADGSLDATFVTNTPNQSVYGIAVLPDGKIMIGGDFTTYGGVARTNIARLNSNGSLDTSFTNTVTSAFTTVYSIVMQPDGKMIIGGSFTAINGVIRNRFARFNTDATLDSLNLNANNTVHCIALQADGKIVVGGDFFNVTGSVTRNNIARLNANGTLDSFDPNAASTVHGMAIQPDGKIVVGGFFTTMGGVARNKIARLLNDGTSQSLSIAANRLEWLRGGALADTAGVTFDFSTDGGSNWIALGAGSAISGGWELTGLSLPPAGQMRARARTFGGRYNGSSGLAETNAAFSGFTAATPIVLTTSATSLNVLGATLNASINPSGLGTAAQFEYGTTTNYGLIAGITLSPTNGASAQNVSASIAGLTGGTTYHFRAVASNSAGISFGSNVTFATLAQPEIAVEQPAGTHLADGISTVSFGTAMVANAGSPLTFVIRNLGVADLTGLVISKDGTHAADFTVDTNGMSTTVTAGASTSFTVTFAPLSTTGTRTAAIHIANNDSDENPFDISITGTAIKAGDLDLAFNPNSSDFMRAAAVQVDGKIVVNGIFTSVGGTARTNLARLNADGTLDASFNPAPNSSVDALTLESSRKILVGGFFTNVGAQARNRIARLNTNGSADAALNSGANNSVNSIVPQPDGKLILCGSFTDVAGLIRNRIARLNADGTVDTNFNPNANSSVTSALVQSDGKIIVWGNFSIISGMARNGFARLNADGTADGSYNAAPDSSVACAALQPDGKVLVGGQFFNIGGAAHTRIARLNTDGTADASFTPLANEYVSTISIQTDGRILVAGDFTSIAGAGRTYIARLQTNGTIDTIFNPAQGFGTYGIALQTDGKIIITGSFTSAGGQGRNRIARLLNDSVSHTLTVASADRVEWLRSGASPEAQWVRFDLSVDGGTNWLSLGSGTRIAGGWERTGLNLPASGQVRAQACIAGGSGNVASWVVEEITNFSGLPAPEIAVEQPAGTNLDNQGSRNFGYVLLGDSPSLTFSITNSGTTTLTGISITKDGTHANDFTVNTNGMSAIVQALGGTTFTVTFAPGALGARSAAIHIANNDADENPFDIALNGTGVAPEIVVQEPAGMNLIDGAATINFGSLIPGTSSATRTFTISNSGSATLLGLAITQTGANSNDFNVNITGTSTSLAPGASTTFTVTFTPPVAGARGAALQIASSDVDENPFDINLTGDGLNRSPVVANPIPNLNATATLPFSHTFAVNTFSDADAEQALTYTATRTNGAALPAWLTFTAGTRTFSGTPSPGNIGTLNVRVTATDNGTPSLSTNDDFDIVVAPIAPTVATLPAVSPGAFGATLQATINPNGLTTAADFEYGTSTSYGASANITLSPPDGTNAQNVSVVISGLAPNTMYHFRAVATNGAGGNAGIDRIFTTTPPPPGIADTNFNPTSLFGILCLALQPDGKILAGGDFALINDNISYIPRLNPDGTTDFSFNPFNFSRTFTLLPLPDGKVLAGGSQANAFTGIQMIRLNPNGSLDNSLEPFAFNNYVWSIAMQADGKAVVGGSFTTAFGQPRNCLARVNADGTLDASFNPNANGQVYAALVLPDGKVFVCGNFTQIGGQTHNYMARLNADGTPDNTFVASHNASVHGAALQADGKILVIRQLAFTVALQIGRLNLDGAWDLSFTSTATHNNSVNTMAVQTDGKIVVGGDFTQMVGQPRARIARLNADGSLDPLFNPGANQEVLAVTLQADGKILVGGQFTNISGTAHTRLARLNNDPAPQSLTVPGPNRVEWLRGGASPEAVSVTFEMSADGGNLWTPLGVGTRLFGGWEKTGFTLPPSGLIRARARVAGGWYGNSYGLLETTVSFSGFPPSAPYPITLPAVAVTQFGAALRASIDPAGSATTAQFEYGTNSSYGSAVVIALSPNNGVTG